MMNDRLETGDPGAASVGRLPTALALTVIVIAAAALRFWNLGAGIPYDLNIDEPQIMSRSVEMMRTGNFNPHFFDYPGLYLHLQMATAALRFLFGATRGEWASLNDVGMEDFFLWGRAVTALFGTGTVLLVYLAGRHWGTAAAIFAAALLAVLPSHVRESHFILTDTPATFFATLALVLTLRAHKIARTRSFAAAGVACGLAAAMKYNAGMVILVPVLGAMFSGSDVRSGRGLAERSKRTGAVLLSAIGAFLLAAPYTVLALPEFLNGFAHLAQAYPSTSAGGEPGLVIYLKHLRNGLGRLASLVACAGLILAALEVVRGDRRVRALCATVFPLAYLFVISGRGLIYGRYLLPLLPFVGLLAGVAVDRAWSSAFWLRRAPRAGQGLTVVIALLALVSPLQQAWGFNANRSVAGTPALAYEWIANNVPRHASIAVEARALLLPSSRYRSRQIPLLSGKPAAEILECYDYVVASSVAYADVFRDPQRQPVEHALYADLFLKGERAATFSPSAQHPGPELVLLRMPPNPARRTCP